MKSGLAKTKASKPMPSSPDSNDRHMWIILVGWLAGHQVTEPAL
jgi:hypothetical protein